MGILDKARASGWRVPGTAARPRLVPRPESKIELGFKYADGDVPKDYRCTECGAFGVKLWRQCNTFHIRLFCACCALEDQGKDGPVGNDGRRLCDILGHGRMTDQIGSLVPAVLDEECEAYWGYTSVPEEGCEWWRGLPTSNEHVEIVEETI